MQAKNNSSIPRPFIIISVTAALLLAAFGIASGNNPMSQPDLKTYEKQLQNNPVKAEQLAEWMMEGRRDFQVAGFRTADECRDQKNTTRMFKCYDKNNINDIPWVRKTFKNIKMPLIIYGTDTADGLATAALLKHLGYDVQYLDEGFNGFASHILDGDGDEASDSIGHYFAGKDPLVKKKGDRWVMASADDAIEEEEEEVELGDDDEEEDEEEEEGC